MLKKIFIFVGIGAFFACNSKQEKQDNAMEIARVLDVVLYKKDIKNVIPKGLKAVDSLTILKNYINSWAKRQLLLHKARVNMPQRDDQTIQKLVREYKEDLQINIYKEALLHKQLDTVVTPEQIKSYYNIYKENFKIKEPLVRFKYIVMEANDSKRRRWSNLLNSNRKKDIEELEKISQIFKKSFLKDSIWIGYKSFLEKVPILKKEKKVFAGRFFNRRDALGLHYIKIVDMLKKDKIAPVGYVYPIITKIILHKRKLALLQKIEDILLNDAIKNKQFKMYEN